MIFVLGLHGGWRRTLFQTCLYLYSQMPHFIARMRGCREWSDRNVSCVAGPEPILCVLVKEKPAPLCAHCREMYTAERETLHKLPATFLAAPSTAFEIQIWVGPIANCAWSFGCSAMLNWINFIVRCKFGSAQIYGIKSAFLCAQASSVRPEMNNTCCNTQSTLMCVSWTPLKCNCCSRVNLRLLEGACTFGLIVSRRFAQTICEPEWNGFAKMNCVVQRALHIAADNTRRCVK